MTFAPALAAALMAAAGACSSGRTDVAFGEGGGKPMGGSANQGGIATAGGDAGAVSRAGSAAAGANGVAGSPADGGTSSGGTSSGGTSSGGTSSGGMANADAGSPGESGAASVGGAASTSCDEGCVKLCEAGMCTCSCPRTALKCPSAAQPNETSFSSSCKVDGDCFGAEHYTGCCRVAAVGLNVSQRESFTLWEKDTCQSPPVCGCAVDTLTADDGKMIGRDMSYAVRCVAGKCASWIP